MSSKYIKDFPKEMQQMVDDIAEALEAQGHQGYTWGGSANFTNVVKFAIRQAHQQLTNSEKEGVEDN